MSVQVITFDARYAAEIEAGHKTSTTRWGESIVVGPAMLEVGGRRFRAEILTVEHYPAATLTPAQAHAAPDADMTEWVRQLRQNHYPQMPADAVIDVVTFRVVP